MNNTNIRPETFRRLVGKKFFGLKFIKKDKSIRELNGIIAGVNTFNPQSKGLTARQKEADKENNIIRVYDIQKLKEINESLDLKSRTLYEDIQAMAQKERSKAWRSFTTDRFVSVKIDGVEIFAF